MRAPLRLLCAIVLLGVLIFSATAQADTERSLTDPTAWWWLHGVSAQDITDLINNEGARLIDLEVEDDSPLTFSAAFVHNSGPYAATWWWLYGQTTASLSTFLADNDARIIDLERYSTSSGDFFAAVMVHNVGTNAKSWWWYVGQTAGGLSTLIDHNNARLVDIEGFDSATGGGRLYDAVMISNTGADFSNWSWLLGQTAAQVGNFLSGNNDRILDLDTYGSGSSRVFDVVTKDNPQGKYWWWWWGFSASGVTDLINQHGARIADIEPYFELIDGSLQKRFAVMMLNNSNDLTTDIATQLGYGTDGVTGFYLKSLSTGVLANINEGYRFEPASTLKIICHLHAMRQVMLGADNLGNNVMYSINYNGSCPIGGAPFTTQSLSSTLSDMMYFSDNAATKGIVDRYTAASIENTAQNVAGMVDTELNHTLGCGPPNGDPNLYNRLTLLDAAALFEGVTNGSLLSGFARDQFYALMQSDLTPVPSQWWLTTQIRDMIFDEASNLGIPDAASSYWANVRLAWKPGGYTLCWPNCLEYRAVAGWISLPQCGGRIGLSSEEYVFGLFIHAATNTAFADSRLFDTTKELLREEVRQGLLSCPTDAPVVASRDARVLLEPNVPNPFNPRTNLRFHLETPGYVRLAVFDLRGRELTVLKDEWTDAGDWTVRWDGTDRFGETVASGAYMVRIESDGEVDARKVLLSK